MILRVLFAGCLLLACLNDVSAIIRGRSRKTVDDFLQAPNATNPSNNARAGKLFSLFNVVKFQNDPCTSTQSIAGSNNRNGTCMTASECMNRNGVVAGNCAVGFGSCCVFIFNSGSATINENCTFIQNTGFPSALNDTTGITFTVQKCSPEVCDLRLDFETFNTVASALTTEVDGGACTDMLTITTPSNMQIPVICGSNTGDHIYVNMGNLATDMATLAFTFTGAATTRMFDIKVTQFECGSQSVPPNTCLQYLTGVTGRIQSFNFDATMGTTHLANQEYSVCIRQEVGFCCVQYQVCPNEINPFSLITQGAGAMIAQTGAQCLEDLITIDGAMAQCMQGTSGPVVSRLCGSFLNTVNGVAANSIVCDCNEPFLVGISTDASADVAAGANTNAAQLSRGVCLEYMQIPCSQ